MAPELPPALASDVGAALDGGGGSDGGDCGVDVEEGGVRGTGFNGGGARVQKIASSFPPSALSSDVLPSPLL